MLLYVLSFLTSIVAIFHSTTDQTVWAQIAYQEHVLQQISHSCRYGSTIPTSDMTNCRKTIWPFQSFTEQISHLSLFQLQSLRPSISLGPSVTVKAWVIGFCCAVKWHHCIYKTMRNSEQQSSRQAVIFMAVVKFWPPNNVC